MSVRLQRLAESCRGPRWSCRGPDWIYRGLNGPSKGLLLGSGVANVYLCNAEKCNMGIRGTYSFQHLGLVLLQLKRIVHTQQG